MRTFANTLLFSGTLERIPPTVDGNIYSATQILLNLPVTIVEADCQTMLGTNRSLSLGLVGYIEVATGQPLTTARINYLLANGATSVYVRDTSSCISEGGICQTCYSGSFSGVSVPPIGSRVEVAPIYLVGNQYFFGTGSRTSFPITYNTTNTVGNIVYVNDVIVPFNYTVTNNTLTLPTPPAFNEIVAIRSLVKDTTVFVDLLSKSYSGDLLGANPKTTGFSLPVKRTLYETALAGSVLNGVQSTVQAITKIPLYLRTYGETISSPLEAVLFYIYLYLIFT